jgi:hypothetical protein
MHNQQDRVCVVARMQCMARNKTTTETKESSSSFNGLLILLVGHEYRHCTFTA